MVMGFVEVRSGACRGGARAGVVGWGGSVSLCGAGAEGVFVGIQTIVWAGSGRRRGSGRRSAGRSCGRAAGPSRSAPAWPAHPGPSDVAGACSVAGAPPPRPPCTAGTSARRRPRPARPLTSRTGRQGTASSSAAWVVSRKGASLHGRQGDDACWEPAGGLSARVGDGGAAAVVGQRVRVPAEGLAGRVPGVDLGQAVEVVIRVRSDHPIRILDRRLRAHVVVRVGRAFGDGRAVAAFDGDLGEQAAEVVAVLDARGVGGGRGGLAVGGVVVFVVEVGLGGSR